MCQQEPMASKESAQPTVPTWPSSIDSARHNTPALSNSKDSDSAHQNSAPGSSQGSARGSPGCPSPRAISRGSFRASRTSSCGDAMRVTVPVKGADMSKTIPDSDIDDPAPTSSSTTLSVDGNAAEGIKLDHSNNAPADVSVLGGNPSAARTPEADVARKADPDSKDQERSITPHESSSPQPIPVFNSATFGRKDPATGKDIRTTRRTRAGRRAPTYAEVGPRSPMSANVKHPAANVNHPAAFAKVYTGQAQFPPHLAPPLSAAMTRLPLHPVPGNSLMPPNFMAPPYVQAGVYPPGYLPGHSRFMYAQESLSAHPSYAGIANPLYVGMANPVYGGIQQALQAPVGAYFGGQAHSMPIYHSAQSQALPPTQALPIQRGYHGRLDFATSSTQVELEQAPELFYVRQRASYTQQHVSYGQQQRDGPAPAGLEPMISHEGAPAPPSPPPEETDKYYEILPWAVNKPSDKPSKPVAKTAKPVPASAKPALVSVPAFRRASSAKQIPSLKQTPSLKRPSSSKRTPSADSVDVDPIEAAFHSHENTVLGNSVEEVLARMDLEAAEESTQTPVAARDGRSAFAFAATSENSALRLSTTATSFGPLGPYTARQIDAPRAPLPVPMSSEGGAAGSAGERAVVNDEEEWAPSEHRGFHW